MMKVMGKAMMKPLLTILASTLKQSKTVKRYWRSPFSPFSPFPSSSSEGRSSARCGSPEKCQITFKLFKNQYDQVNLTLTVIGRTCVFSLSLFFSSSSFRSQSMMMWMQMLIVVLMMKNNNHMSIS